jgi:hypothetical protein
MTYSDQLLIVEITSLEDRDDQVKKSLLSRSTTTCRGCRRRWPFVMITEIGRATVRSPRAQPEGPGFEPVG